jgi:hypothetical protein
MREPEKKIRNRPVVAKSRRESTRAETRSSAQMQARVRAMTEILILRAVEIALAVMGGVVGARNAYLLRLICVPNAFVLQQRPNTRR